MKKNLSNLMTFLSLTMVLAVVMPMITHAQAGKTNFDGTWELNESKSTLPGGGSGSRMVVNFTITQDANLITRTSTGLDGTQRVTKFTLDGKESVNTTPRGESKSVASWSADGKILTVKTSSDYNGNTFTSTAIWTKQDDKTLSISTTSTGREGTEIKLTMVYDKK